MQINEVLDELLINTTELINQSSAKDQGGHITAEQLLDMVDNIEYSLDQLKEILSAQVVQ